MKRLLNRQSAKKMNFLRFRGSNIMTTLINFKDATFDLQKTLVKDLL
jgi:hypothetical protein